MRENAASPQEPFLGLRPFGELEAAYFFGRDHESAELRRRVEREVVTVLFGKSGLGKTSLLRAGLFPLLRREHVLPVPVRLSFGDGEPDLVAQVKTAVVLAASHAVIEAPEAGDDETLWEYFHRATFWSATNHLVTPLIVIDQFEEIFTLGPGHAGVEPFLRELADLVENRIPRRVRRELENEDRELAFAFEKQRFRVVLSLREDFLPQLEELRAAMPSLGRNRLRLSHLDGVQALEAVLEPGREIIDAEVAEQVVRFVAGTRMESGYGASRIADELARLEVEPALLSLVCHELNRRRRDLGSPTISAALLSGRRQEILVTFYERCLEGRPSALRRLVEDRLITTSGFRSTVALDDAVRLPGVARGDIDQLVERRLLRREERLGIPHLELVHDVLTDVVRASRDRRQLRERQRRRFRRRAAVMGGLALFAALAGGLAIWSVRARDEARAQEQKIARRLAELQAEQGRQELLQERWQQALAFLGEAAEVLGDEPALRVLLERATDPLEARVASLEGHTGAVWDVRASPEGVRVATAGRDGTVRIWDVASGRQELLLNGHRDAVTALSWSPDGERLATAGRDGTARLWDARKGRPSAILEGHRGAVLWVEHDPLGSRIATAGEDGTARLWSAEGELEQVLGAGGAGHAGPVVSARFGPGGRRLLTVSFDGSARLWDVADGRQLLTVAAGQDELLAASFDPRGTRFATVGADATCKLWDAASGGLLARFEDVRARLSSVAFTPDGRRLVTANRRGGALVWSDDGRLWGSLGAELEGSSASGELAAHLAGSRLSDRESEDPWQRSGAQLALVDPVRRATLARFSGGGDRILVGGELGGLQVWERESGRPLGAELAAATDEEILEAQLDAAGQRAVIETRSGSTSAWDVVSGRSLGALPAGSVLAPDGDRYLATLTGGAELRTLDGGSLIARLAPTSVIVHAAFDATGTRLLTQDVDLEVRLWDGLDGRLLVALGRRPPRPGESLGQVARFSSEGGRLVIADSAGVELLDAASGRRLARFAGAGPVALDPAGGRMALAAEDLAIFDLGTGLPIRRLKQPVSEPSAPAAISRLFLAGGTVVALMVEEARPEGGAASFEASALRSWDARSGRQVGQLGETDPERADLQDLWLVALDPTGEHLVTAQTESTQIRDARSLEPRRVFRYPIWTIDFHPDRPLAIGLSPEGRMRWLPLTLDGTPGQDSGAEEVRVAPGRVAAGEHWFRGAEISPDGERIATTDSRGEAVLWDASSGRRLRTFAGAGSTLWATRFSSDGRRLIGAGNEGRAEIWETRNDRPLLLAEPAAKVVGGPVVAADLSADGTHVGLAGPAGAAVWRLADGLRTPPLEGSARGLRSLRFDPGGDRLAAIGAGGELVLWQVASGRRLWEAPATAARELGWSAEGRRLATAGDDRAARVWDAESGELLATFELRSYPLDAIALDPRHPRAFVGGESTAVLWNSNNGGYQLGLDLELGSFVTTALFDPTGELLLTAGWPPSVRLWQAATGELLGSLDGHNGTVIDADISTGGDLILTVSDDGTAKVWDGRNTKLLASFALGTQLPVRARFASDAEGFTTIQVDGEVRRWSLVADHGGAGELARLIGCWVPWKLVAGRLLPVEPDPLPCSRRFALPSGEKTAVRPAALGEGSSTR